jgi:hypothetical protein
MQSSGVARDRQVVSRRCRMCEWEGELIETGDSDPDCPWCHAPTRRVRVVAVTDRRRSSASRHAAALGRLGGLKGGRARAEALSPERRREIARAAARARWTRRKRPRGPGRAGS